MDACILKKIINNLCDFPDIVYVNGHTNPMQLVNIWARINQFYHSFFPKTIALWNSLPSSLLSSLSLNSFKLGLSQHFNFYVTYTYLLHRLYASFSYLQLIMLTTVLFFEQKFK